MADDRENSPLSIVRLISFNTSVVALPRVKDLSMWSSFNRLA